MAPKSDQLSSKAGSLSSLSSLSLSSSSSLSQKAASIKSAVKKGVKALTRPFKKAKTQLSTHSKSSSKASPETGVTSVRNDSSDIEIVEADPEKELSASPVFHRVYIFLQLFVAEVLKKSWRSPIYSFFKSDGVSVQYHDGRLCHFFPCAALKCKTAAGGVRRFQDSKDRSSTANLKQHAIRCFGEEAVNNAIGGKAAIPPSASIFSLFAHQGQQPVQYSHRAHTNPEVR
jgi:hypothetical protein